ASIPPEETTFIMNMDPGEERSARRRTQPGPAQTPRSPRLRVKRNSAALCEPRALRVTRSRGGRGETPEPPRPPSPEEQHGPRGLARVAAAPVRLADPVAQLGRGVGCDLALPGQALDVRGIVGAEGPEQQPLGEQLGLVARCHGPHSLSAAVRPSPTRRWSG